MRLDWLITELNTLGGAETFVRLAAPRLRKLGWDLRLITLSGGGYLVEELRHEGVPLIELGVNALKDFWAVFKLLRLWQVDKPRLLHTHLYHAGILGRLAGSLMGIRPIIVQQAGPELQRSKARAALDRLTSPLVSQYVTTCQAVKGILQSRERIPAEKIAVIPNGIVTEDYQHPPARPEGFPPAARSPVLGVVGRLSPEKGHFLLLEALSILRQQRISFHAVIIGDGALKDELAQKTKALHLEDAVFWVGAQVNLPAWLPCFDLFVLPSHWEGISLALLEAMAAGLPAVATSVGGNPEVIENGETGLLVSSCDPQRLAEAIGKLIENPALRLEMGRAAQIRCQERFHIEAIVQRIDALYRRLLNVP